MLGKQTVKTFSVSYILNALGGSLAGSIFILFLTAEKDFNPEQINLIIAVTPLLIIPSIILWGKILDRYKKLILMIRLVAVANLVTLGLLCVIKDFRVFFIINFIRAILLQPSASATDEYLLNLTSKVEVPYGKIRMCGTLGYGLAGVIAPFIIGTLGIKAIMGVGMVLLGISFFTFKKIPEIEMQSLNVSPKKIKFDFTLFKNKRYVTLLIITGVLFGTLNAASSYGNQIVLMQYKAPNELIGMLPFIMIILEVIMLGSIHKFKVVEKPYFLFLIALMILALRWVLMAITTSYIIVFLITALHGLVVGMVLTAQNSILGSIVPSEQRSLAFIINATVGGTIIPSLVNLVTGNLSQVAGNQIFGYTYLLLTLIGIILVIPCVKKEKCVYSYNYN
ncbi:MAG: MFS transporter [Cellulosilyticaceae bacterium]